MLRRVESAGKRNRSRILHAAVTSKIGFDHHCTLLNDTESHASARRICGLAPLVEMVAHTLRRGGRSACPRRRFDVGPLVARVHSARRARVRARR